MEKYVFGIDIGGTTVKCGLFTVKGELLEKWEIPTRTENNGAAILPDVADTVLKKIQEKGLAKEEIAGIGIGVPGPVNEQGEVPGAVNLHWGYVNLAGDMEKMTGLRVKAGNDANVAALGEMWKGGGAGCQLGCQLIMVAVRRAILGFDLDVGVFFHELVDDFHGGVGALIAAPPGKAQRHLFIAGSGSCGAGRGSAAGAVGCRGCAAGSTAAACGQRQCHAGGHHTGHKLLFHIVFLLLNRPFSSSLIMVLL